MLSLITKTTVQKSKFDVLRKVAHYHAINKKIDKWVTSNKVPAYYPRGIDQIRKFYTDIDVKAKKVDMALVTILE